jgi:hypothetical protein
MKNPLSAFWTFFSVLGAVALAAPSEAAAVGCDCGSLSALLARSAQTVVQGIVTPLSAMTEKAAGYQTVNLHQDLVAIREAVINAQEQTAEAVERAEQAAADRSSERTYEPASQPLTNCFNDLLGSVWRGSSEILSAAEDELMARAAARNGRSARPADFLKEINRSPLVPGSLSRLIGAASGPLTLTGREFDEAGQMLGELTDPLPAPSLPAGRETSPAGQLYAAAKKDLESRLTVYQGILARRLAERAPAVGGLSAWTEKKWQDMGGSGPPPGLINGQVSETTLIWYLTNLRLGSGHWHEKILPALPEPGLLREIAAMAAVQLELSRRQNAHLENISLMMALEGLELLDQRRRPALRNQYRLAAVSREQP